VSNNVHAGFSTVTAIAADIEDMDSQMTEEEIGASRVTRSWLAQPQLIAVIHGPRRDSPQVVPYLDNHVGTKQRWM
jgi:hypothetical protein